MGAPQDHKALVLDAALELQRRRKARTSLYEYVKYTKKGYKESLFAMMVCMALEQFIADVLAGKRPILVFQAPPQHGKSELVSRRFVAYLMGRMPAWRIGGASYGKDLSGLFSQDVRRILASDEHQALFPSPAGKRKYAVDRNGEFSNPNGEGSYIGVGVGGGLTGRSLDIGIIDDPIKNAEEALSVTGKESDWNWYQTVFTSRLQELSGQIIMATSWAEDDLPGRIIDKYRGDDRLTVLRFPAINDPSEVGFNPLLPLGPLVPELHSLAKLHETKGLFSDYWWSAMYQQSPKSLGGNVFKEDYVRYYYPKDLPAKFDKIIDSWDCTFKDTDGTDFVVGQKWAKRGANVYLMLQDRERKSFTKTCHSVIALRNEDRATREVLIEDKANGPAVIDTLKDLVPGLIPIEPDGSKLARAHAVTSFWEAGNIWLPHPDTVKLGPKGENWVKILVAELTAFPASANDDQVDALTQAVRRLLGGFKGFKITSDLLAAAAAARR